MQAQPEVHAVKTDRGQIDNHVPDSDRLCFRIGQPCEIDESRQRRDQRSDNAASESVKSDVILTARP
jgi:hypothetical protein